MNSLARAVAALRRERTRGPPHERRAHAERAIDGYLAWCARYAFGLAVKSEREANHYLRTGETASLLPTEPAQIKPDRTHVTLYAYQAWLGHLRSLGVYTGGVNLKRMRPDGTWEDLLLPGEIAAPRRQAA